MTQKPSVLICGAGIAGCAAAIALARQGWSVQLIDKQDAWRFQSSGIFVYSNGLHDFHALGVMQPMVASGFEIADGRNVYLHADGSPLVDTFYPSAYAGQRLPPILGIRRAEMHRVLADELDRLGIRVQLGTSIEAMHSNAQGVDVTLTDGRALRCDLLLGADGIRSRVRELLWPHVQPRYSGFGVWRSVHRRPPELREKIMMMAPGLRLGIMPISREQLYLFGTVSAAAGVWHERAQWPALMQQAFAVFQGPVRPLLDELATDSEVLYTAVEEIIMPAPWHQGRVLLIGDAAHACTPFMGQGGAMAVQDAVVIARLLASSSIDAALADFGRIRAPVCQFVQDVSRQVGITGAQSEPGAHHAITQAVADSGQQRVDDFYRRLQSLSAPDGQALTAPA
jgi:2-polyprenyl-6-methoxyphenol hydroxylase-like FAD-dependent oxidoreductase